MIYTKESITSKRITLPVWFTANKSIKSAKNYTKLFDNLGLPDFGASSKPVKDHTFKSELSKIEQLFDFDDISSHYSHKELLSFATIFYILREANFEKGLLSKHIIDNLGKVLIKKGTTFKKMIENITVISKCLGADFKLDIARIINSSGKTSKVVNEVVFSTDPWDILTMSMRGIESCMRWGSHHSTALVGSVLCPYVGIIYSKKSTSNKYGSLMKYRSTVRLVKNKKLTGNKFSVFVEGAYPKKYDAVLDRESSDTETTLMFKDVLSKKIKGNKNFNPEVLTEDYVGLDNLYAPLTPKISDLNLNYRSYSDADIQYWQPKK